MSRWLIVGVALTGVGLLWLWRYGQRPYRYKNVQSRDLGRFFDTLLKRGHQGGLLILEANERTGEHRFLQFAKYMRPDGRAGLEFGFPLAPWSRPYYELLRRKLDAGGVRSELQDTGRQDTVQFLVVNLGRDLATAQRVAEIAVEAVFGRPDSAFQASYENVSPRDEQIGR